MNANSTRLFLEAVEHTIRRYVVLPSSEAGAALALWVAHSWAPSAAHATPYLAVLSPERRSGKTRLLEVLELLVRLPWRTNGASEAALFRRIAEQCPTLLLDEVDAIFGSDTERTEPLRAVLNGGNRPGSSVARCVGEGGRMTVRDFEIYSPKVLAGIDTGRLPETIRDRSIVVRMKRRADGEPVARFRYRHAQAATAELVDALAAWATEHEAALLEAEPDLPDQLNDRAAEAWEPLLAIADLAGGNWPARARAAALALNADGDSDDAGHGSRLLAALRDGLAGRDAVSTADLLALVNGDDELPFGGWRDGRGLDSRILAKLLKPYGVKPRTVKIDGNTAKGYRRDEATEDAFARYLTPPVTQVTQVTANPGEPEAWAA